MKMSNNHRYIFNNYLFEEHRKTRRSTKIKTVHFQTYMCCAIRGSITKITLTRIKHNKTFTFILSGIR